MQTRQLLIFIALSLIAVVAVMAAVSAFRRTEPPVQVQAPAASVDTDKSTGKTTIDAPYAHIEKDNSGTKIEAPGVKIEVPKSPNP
ncbi:hypothetical protein [Hyphomicrobium sp.]|uniref:hypothetical protein n=1 Tax=Hyphomicrobium sp. TaxID=82 RepID=UPI000FB76355|nr:hypothetical protein [Hyphomicrobium sp.]RUO98114.1 MAG: hypothetical protein EKK30_15465 [Hyphomicrobium sp.]